MHTPAALIALLSSYGYVLLLPLAIVEGPIVSILAGFLAAQGIFVFWIAYGVVVLGDLIGDVLHYALGRWGGKALRKRFKKIQSLHESAASDYLREQPGKALTFGKLTHSAGFAFLVAAGAVRVPFGTFILYNFLATLPKALLFMGIGYFVGSSYAAINAKLGIVSLVLLVLVMAFLFWFVRKRLIRAPHAPQTPEI